MIRGLSDGLRPVIFARPALFTKKPTIGITVARRRTAQKPPDRLAKPVTEWPPGRLMVVANGDTATYRQVGAEPPVDCIQPVHRIDLDGGARSGKAGNR